MHGWSCHVLRLVGDQFEEALLQGAPGGVELGEEESALRAPRGEGGHGAAPHKGVDAIAVAADGRIYLSETQTGNVNSSPVEVNPINGVLYNPA